MSETLQLSMSRLSFPKLIEASANKDFPNSPKKFAADLILDPQSNDYAKIMAEVGNLATGKWKEQATPILQMIQGDRRLRCYGSGAEKLDKKTMKPYEGYEGRVYISASSNEDRPPIMVDASGNPIDNANTMARNAAARKLYGGCYVNAAIRLWIQDNQFGRGIRCELIALQFAKDGEPFGEAAPDVTGMFGQVQQPVPAFAAPGLPKMPWEQ
jgi:hypothetical protein